MKNALELTEKEYQSSSGRTPEYLRWHRTFKREFTKFLTERGAIKVEIGKPNHFDISGFFTSPAGQVWYFRVEDIRWSKDKMLIRKAQTYRDYTGGQNEYISLAGGENVFAEQFHDLMADPEPVEA